MPKVVIEVKDNKDKTTCNAKIKLVSFDKGTETEKNATATIYNTVSQALEQLKNEN